MGGGQASNTIIMPVGMLFVSSGHFILVARRAASGVLRAASVATASKKCNKAGQLIFDYATTAAATMRGSSSNHRQQHSEAAQIVNKNKPNIIARSLSVSLSLAAPALPIKCLLTACCCLCMPRPRALLQLGQAARFHMQLSYAVELNK